MHLAFPFTQSSSVSHLPGSAAKINSKKGTVKKDLICPFSLHFCGEGILNRDLKQPQRQHQRKRLLKIHVGVICATLRLFQFLQLVQCNLNIPLNRFGRNGVQAKTENEKFAVMCSRSPQNLKFGNFTLLFGRAR